MAERIVLCAYLLVGLASALGVGLRGLSVVGARGPAAAGLLLLMWPFLLPALLLPATAPPRRAVGSPRAARLSDLAIALDAAWTGAEPAALREREATRRFVETLQGRQASLEELESVLGSCSAAVRPRLERFRDRATAQLEQGCTLLEEMLAHLTVLRFCGPAAVNANATDRSQIELLLGRLEALGALAEDAPPSSAA